MEFSRNTKGPEGWSEQLRGRDVEDDAAWAPQRLGWWGGAITQGVAERCLSLNEEPFETSEMRRCDLCLKTIILVLSKDHYYNRNNYSSFSIWKNMTVLYEYIAFKFEKIKIEISLFI